jgi:hypothetical protein
MFFRDLQNRPCELKKSEGDVKKRILLCTRLADFGEDEAASQRKVVSVEPGQKVAKRDAGISASQLHLSLSSF